MMRFYYRLAGHLKIGTVEEMLNRMSSAEMTNWLAFSLLEPIGDARGDIQTATIACAAASAFGAKTKLKDWIPDYDKEPKKETPEQANRRFRALLNLGGPGGGKCDTQLKSQATKKP